MYLQIASAGEQKDADENKMINHIHKNRKSNLVGLCKKCHHDVTHNTLVIEGYIQTSTGIELEYYRNKDVKKEIQRDREGSA